MIRPQDIQPDHLLRRAVVYIRQSSPEQVRANTGSTAVQRDLVDKVAAWGWPASRIDVLDGDLGVSGSRPGARDDFNLLLERMRANEIGLVAVVDASRLSRNIVDLLSFVQRAQQYRVLLAEGDQIIDFTDPNSSFIGSILSLNAIRENQTRIRLSVAARRKKALAGIAPTAPPVGYVRRPDGTWVKDPDPRVQETITLIFDKFIELGSLRRVVRYLRTNAIQIPRRRRWNRPLWGDATYASITGFAKNPVYAGRYIFGKTRQEPPAEGSRKRGRQQRQSADHWVVIDEHHTPYVDPGRWAHVQNRICANRINIRPALGRGEALVQGLLRCPVHNRAFHTRYSDRRTSPDGRVIRRHPRYLCLPLRDTGDNRAHCTIRAATVDPVIEHLLLDTLAPVVADNIQEAVRQELRQYEGLQRARQDELRRAEHRVAEAERAFFDADRSQQHLTRRLGERFDQALADLDRLRTTHRLHPLVPPITPDGETLDELRSLLGDLPTVWRRPNVTAEQRKALLRAVVNAIYATPGRDAWTLEVEWDSGARTTVPLIRQPRRKPAYPVKRTHPWRPIPREVYQRIRDEVAAGFSPQAIADGLNASQVPHAFVGSWRKTHVIAATYRLRKGAVPDVEALPPARSLTNEIRALHEAGHSPASIVTVLHSQGLRTRHGTPFTVNTVQATIARLELRSHVAEREARIRTHLREWAAIILPVEIAARLNELGLRTQQGSLWTLNSVREKLRDLAIQFRHQRVPKAATSRRPHCRKPALPIDAVGPATD